MLGAALSYNGACGRAAHRWHGTSGVIRHMPQTGRVKGLTEPAGPKLDCNGSTTCCGVEPTDSYGSPRTSIACVRLGRMMAMQQRASCSLPLHSHCVHRLARNPGGTRRGWGDMVLTATSDCESLSLDIKRIHRSDASKPLLEKCIQPMTTVYKPFKKSILNLGIRFL